MPSLTDTHCHLNLDTYADDRGQVLERAWAAGVARILVPGIDLATSRQAVALAETHSNLYAAVGVHPHAASGWTEETTSALRDLARSPKVTAIGEIGLDYYRDRSPRDQQRAVFQAQLALAAELELPVVLHNRDAWDDFWSILTAWQAQLRASGSTLQERPGVLHSFDGSPEQARQAAGCGFFIGISGPVTFKNAAERHAVAANLPLDRLLIETDSPYLAPQPYRGRRNEPAHVALVAEKLADLHAAALETVVTATWNNAVTLFDWRKNS